MNLLKTFNIINSNIGIVEKEQLRSGRMIVFFVLGIRIRIRKAPEYGSNTDPDSQHWFLLVHFLWSGRRSTGTTWVRGWWWWWWRRCCKRTTNCWMSHPTTRNQCHPGQPGWSSMENSIFPGSPFSAWYIDNCYRYRFLKYSVRWVRDYFLFGLVASGHMKAYCMC